MEKLLKISYFKLSTEGERDFLEDTITDNKQAIEMANVYTTILTGTMDAFASVIGNNMNFIMKRLTIISIALMFPTLIVSFYGMNIELPYMHNPFAWVGALSVCGLSAFLGGWLLSDRRNQRIVQRSVQAKRIKEKKPKGKKRKKRVLPD
jgi:magnesium transporter